MKNVLDKILTGLLVAITVYFGYRAYDGSQARERLLDDCRSALARQAEPSYPTILVEAFPKIIEGQSSGSGVVVSCVERDGAYDLGIVTAGHVVEDYAGSEAKVVDGLRGVTLVQAPKDMFVETERYKLPVRGLSIDARNDLAAVTVRSPRPVATYPLATKAPQVGQPVWCPSWPQGMFFVTQGCYSTPRTSSPNAYPGTSGAATLDVFGNVLGVASKIGSHKLKNGDHVPVTHMLLVVGSPEIRDFLQRTAVAATLEARRAQAEAASRPSTSSRPSSHEEVK